MDKDDIYALWIARRRQTSVPEDFSRRVMDVLLQKEGCSATERRPSRSFLAFAPLRWSTALVLLLAGLLRLSYVTACLLVP